MRTLVSITSILSAFGAVWEWLDGKNIPCMLLAAASVGLALFRLEFKLPGE
jgi:hypothetical protein